MTITGPGYHGQAQNDLAAGSAPGLTQAKAAIISRDVVVRLLVTYHTTGLRGVPQLPEVTTLADHAGKRLARTR